MVCGRREGRSSSERGGSKERREERKREPKFSIRDYPTLGFCLRLLRSKDMRVVMDRDTGHDVPQTLCTTYSLSSYLPETLRFSPVLFVYNKRRVQDLTIFGRSDDSRPYKSIELDTLPMCSHM